LGFFQFSRPATEHRASVQVRVVSVNLRFLVVEEEEGRPGAKRHLAHAMSPNVLQRAPAFALSGMIENTHLFFHTSISLSNLRSRFKLPLLFESAGPRKVQVDERGR